MLDWAAEQCQAVALLHSAHACSLRTVSFAVALAVAAALCSAQTSTPPSTARSTSSRRPDRRPHLLQRHHLHRRRLCRRQAAGRASHGDRRRQSTGHRQQRRNHAPRRAPTPSSATSTPATPAPSSFPDSTTRTCTLAAPARPSSTSTSPASSPWPTCWRRSRLLPKPRPPATGSSAATGTTRSGRRRPCPHARTSTRSPAIIPHFSTASTATSPSPTRPPSKPPASQAAPSPPQGGAIDLDASGEPTGILRESAQDLVYKVIPPPSHDERRKGDELAIADALAHGVTSVQDFSDWQDFLVFEELEKEGNLNLRITEWLPFIDSLDRTEENARPPRLPTIRCCTPAC